MSLFVFNCVENIERALHPYYLLSVNVQGQPVVEDLLGVAIFSRVLMVQ